MFDQEFGSKTNKGDIIEAINGQLVEARECVEKMYCSYTELYETLGEVVPEASEHIKDRDYYIYGLSILFDEEKSKHNELKIKHAQKMAVQNSNDSDKKAQTELIKLLKSNVSSLEKDKKDLQERIKTLESQSRLSDQLAFQREKSLIGIEAQKKKKENELGLKRAERQREASLRTERVQELATRMHGGRASGSWSDAIMVSCYRISSIQSHNCSHNYDWFLFRVMHLRASNEATTNRIQSTKHPCKIIVAVLVAVAVHKEVVATMIVSMEGVEATIGVEVEGLSTTCTPVAITLPMQIMLKRY